MPPAAARLLKEQERRREAPSVQWGVPQRSVKRLDCDRRFPLPHPHRM